MIHVIAVITTQPGQRGKMLEFFQANRAAVLAEDGCMAYEATIDAAGFPTSPGTYGNDTFVVVEQWTSLAALKAHSVAPHMVAFGTATQALRQNVVLHVLEPVTV
jgi:quinol monooxygenase YgiN